MKRKDQRLIRLTDLETGKLESTAPAPAPHLGRPFLVGAGGGKGITQCVPEEADFYTKATPGSSPMPHL